MQYKKNNDKEEVELQSKRTLNIQAEEEDLSFD